MHFYMYVKGQKTGAVNGSVTQKGRENSCLCTWFELGVETPVDQNTGYAAGKRRHQPLKIRKEIDKASPLLYQMAVNNELASSVILKFWKVGTTKTGATGQETQYYTVTLTNAQIRGVKQYTPDHASEESARNQSTYEYEEVQFTYQKIEVVFTDGGISAVDDWEAPVT
jgi:type VI secretion system secreted protein Hcp